MGQILKSTLALVTVLSVLAFLTGLVENGGGLGLYYALLVFGSLIIPVTILVTLYHFLLSRRLLYLNHWKRFLVHTGSMLLVSLAGLFVWAVLEHLIFEGLNLHFLMIWSDFQAEYTRYIPTALILAIMLPPAHYFFAPKQPTHIS